MDKWPQRIRFWRDDNLGVSICIASGKDGTGKSTVTSNLGVALSNMGVNTLTIDADIKGATIGLIMGAMDEKLPTIHDALSGKIPPEKAVIESFGTSLIIGGLRINHLLGVDIDRFPLIIEDFTNEYDIVLVDAPAGLGSDSLMVMSSCDLLIVNLTPDLNSIVHAIKSLVLAKKVKTRILGAIVNREGTPYDVPAEQIGDFLRVKVIGEIHEDDNVKKSIQEALPVYMGYPNSPFSQEIKKIATQLSELI